MKASQVKIEELRSGGLRITVPDDLTDSLAVITLNHRSTSNIPEGQRLGVSVKLRGNFSGSTRYGVPKEQVRPVKGAYLSIKAPRLTHEEWNARRRVAGLPERTREEEKSEPNLS